MVRAGRFLTVAIGVTVVVTSCAVGSQGRWEAGGVQPTAGTSTPAPGVLPSRPAPSRSVSRPRTTPAPTDRAGEDRKDGGAAADAAAAAAYASARGVRAGIAVLDLRTGRFAGGGDYTGRFGSASVMKVLVAVRLLATGQMTGENETLGTAMIERSDDSAVAKLWPLAGGPDVLPWVAAHYHLSGLGTPNTKPGVWGNTHITAKGMVQLYRAIAADQAVGPWLLAAMHQARRTAADGTDQFFGLPSATTGAAVKQGWGARSADDPADAIVNTTGYVEGDRYAVAILAEGRGDNGTTNAAGYNAALARLVTHLATLVLPGGRVR